MDYLKHYNQQPPRVRKIMDSLGDEQNYSIIKLQKAQKDLANIQWFMDYDMDGSIIELRPMSLDI